MCDAIASSSSPRSLAHFHQWHKQTTTDLVRISQRQINSSSFRSLLLDFRIFIFWIWENARDGNSTSLLHSKNLSSFNIFLLLFFSHNHRCETFFVKHKKHENLNEALTNRKKKKKLFSFVSRISSLRPALHHPSNSMGTNVDVKRDARQVHKSESSRWITCLGLWVSFSVLWERARSSRHSRSSSDVCESLSDVEYRRHEPKSEGKFVVQLEEVVLRSCASFFFREVYRWLKIFHRHTKPVRKRLNRFFSSFFAFSYAHISLLISSR